MQKTMYLHVQVKITTVTTNNIRKRLGKDVLPLVVKSVTVPTRIVTLIALFMLPLYSQPCLDTPPF